MLPKATTFRIDPAVQAALETLSKTLKRPMNQLVNEAVKAYVDRRSVEVEQDLEETLARLRAYRRQDPDFEQAIARVAEAEAQFRKGDPVVDPVVDPVEGKVVIGRLVDGQLVEEAGPVQAEIDQLLHG